MLTVILADNERVILDGLLSLPWSEWGCRVVAAAETGDEALTLYHRFHPDIFITDIRMPGLSGLELAARLRDEKSGTRVIILTAYPDFDYAQRAIEYRVSAFIVKPLDPERLSAELSRIRSELGDGRQTAQTQALFAAEESARNRALMREIFLSNLLFNARLSSLKTLLEAKKLGIVLREYLVAEYALVRYRPLLNAVDEDDIWAVGEGAESDAQNTDEDASVRKSIEGLMGEREHYFIRKSETYTYFICAVDAERPERIYESLSSLTSDLNARLESQIGFGVSAVSQDLLNMSVLARQADQALTAVQSLGGSALMRYEDLPAYSPDYQAYAADCVARIYDALEACDQETAKKKCLALFSNPTATASDRQSAYEMLGHLLTITCYNHKINDERLLASLESRPRAVARSTEQCLLDLNGLIDRTVMALRRIYKQDDAGTANEIQAICHYIDAHLSEPLTLNDLAERAHFSPSYLSKQFKAHTGFNLSQFIQKRRIQAACQLLRETDRLNYEIGEMVGLPDPVYFSKLFRKHMGESPSDYRKNLAR